ncbi:MAG: phospho-N-acetylmuramoyl-pentapeptide-transferase [Chloroflexi bacterium]|nr:MAG: phospho-N-acetylmuramoyl-pentapeptide-transferase [Chloroflexota bacterium]
MSYALVVGFLSFVVALIAGGPVVRWLQERHLGKAISELGPSSHQVKAGTPTMGGLLIFGTVAAVTVFTNINGHLSILLPLSVVLSMLIVGVIDDKGTLVGQRNAGLSWRLKLVLIAILSVVVSAVCYYLLDARSVNIPDLGKFDIGISYLAVAFIVVFATTTSVAITDGLDGLLGGTAAVAFVAYGIIAVAQEQNFVATFCLTVAGALLGFLWFNAHPARVFMGDTGALPLGAALGTVALMTGHWLLLPVIGVVFVAEAASDLIQIAYFKTTGGRRIFRMAPLHNHLELIGWSEPQIVTRLWLVSIAGGMVGIALALAV